MPQLKDKYPYILANESVYANTDLAVTDKYSGEVATKVALADASVETRPFKRLSTRLNP